MSSTGRPKNWHKLRRLVLERDKGLCQICLKKGEYEPAKHVDHIIPLHKKIDNRLKNLQSLCIDCHAAKTAAEKGKGKGACIHGYIVGMYCPKCKKIVERKHYPNRNLQKDSVVTRGNLRNNPGKLDD